MKIKCNYQKLRNLNVNAKAVKRIHKTRISLVKQKKLTTSKSKKKEEIKLYLKIRMNQKQKMKQLKLKKTIKN